ncbi:MAG: hypothetical protein KatS3mg057_1615 [Herpetosiphonaceae bacterium]|nr:MAG: hypothetical protein KatS3mg057_1615 [Herpetosiphonaceae bacterium]
MPGSVRGCRCSQVHNTGNGYMRKGTANLPLHSGHAPRWLFERMVAMSAEIASWIVVEHGTAEFLRRLSDPVWFQAFGAAIGMDWHSSGVTTTICGALKQGLRERGKELGLVVAGGKGRTSRQTPAELMAAGEWLDLDAAPYVAASRLAAKIDNNALQDGYQLYHHVFLLDRDGHWAIIQQGMHETNGYARRYHWLGDEVRSFVDDPHSAIASQSTGPVWNLVAHESAAARDVTTALAREQPEKIVAQVAKLREMTLPTHHDVKAADIDPRRLQRILLKTYDRQPEDFASLLGMEGVGARTLRALSMLGELVYGAPVSITDPARFAFAHGGKDGYPYPVDRSTYDANIQLLRTAVERARLGQRDQVAALKRLAFWSDDTGSDAGI